MKIFNYHQAASVEQAVALKSSYPAAVFLAGGTDLLVKMKQGQLSPDDIIDIGNIPSLSRIDISPEGVFIGAAVKVAEIAKSPALQAAYPCLTGAAFALGSPEVRNLATLGGNICNASPSADLLPALYALDANMCVAGPEGERRLAVEDFLLGPGQNALQEGELLTGVYLPHLTDQAATVYLKHTLKRSMDIAVAGVGILVEGVAPVQRCRIVLGAVGPTPLRAFEAEAYLTGQVLDEQAIALAAQAAGNCCQPIDDIRTTAEYRMEIIQVLCRRGLTMIANKQGGECCHVSH